MSQVGQPAVREALHVPTSANFFDGDNGAGMVYRNTEPDLRPFYQHVANSTALRVLVYNGDTDPAINSFVAQAQNDPSHHAAAASASSPRHHTNFRVARTPSGCARLHTRAPAFLTCYAPLGLSYLMAASLTGLDLAPGLYSHAVVASVDHRRMPPYGRLRDAVRGAACIAAYLPLPPPLGPSNTFLGPSHTPLPPLTPSDTRLPPLAPSHTHLHAHAPPLTPSPHTRTSANAIRPPVSQHAHAQHARTTR